MAGGDGREGNHGSTKSGELVLDNLGEALAIGLAIVHDRQVLDVQLVV